MNCAWTLPFPTGVSTNALYRGFGHARTLTPAAAAWRDTVIVQIRQKAIDAGEKLALPSGNLAFWLDVFPPDDHREHDGDNLLKWCVDCVMAAFGELDPRVVEYHVFRYQAYGPAKLAVMVTTSRFGETVDRSLR